jgi:glucose/mannose transport system permease protein
VGLDQYERLWSDAHYWYVSITNLAIFGVLSMIFTLLIGFMLAALLDRKVAGEDVFRTIFLYPFALSFIVTGLAWQWILNPQYGVQHIVRSSGWESFTFDPLYDADLVLYGLLIAGLWQGTGLIMCIMLAGLRGIDEDIWKAARVDGSPPGRPTPTCDPHAAPRVHHLAGADRVGHHQGLRPRGGPNLRRARPRLDMPAIYVMQNLFGAQNLGQASPPRP